MPKKQGFCVEENTYGVYVLHNSGGIKQCYRHTKGQPPKRYQHSGKTFVNRGTGRNRRKNEENKVFI